MVALEQEICVLQALGQAEKLFSQGPRRLTFSSQSRNPPRSYWIPGSWDLRIVYTDDISCHDP